MKHLELIAKESECQIVNENKVLKIQGLKCDEVYKEIKVNFIEKI